MGQRPAPYEHYRPTDGTADPGVYRVVGLDDETVTLLRVTDGDGGRLHGGGIDTVGRARLSEEFVAVANPDEGGDRLTRALSGVGVGFLVVAGLSWLGVLTTPATPGTLVTIGLLLVAAGRVVDRVLLTSLLQ